MKVHPDELSLLDRGGRPTLADMLDKLSFSPTRCSIELNGARMVLSRASIGADLQDELVRRLGQHDAMVFMLRQGYRAGREDAEFIRRAWPGLDIGDAFTAGTRLHMVTGTVRVETQHNDFDFKKDRFSGDFLWHQSVEASEYQRRHGRATVPVCWAQTGYAAGYASVFFRKLILYKEVSCAAMGAKSCRVVGKTVDEWGDDDPFVRTFLNEVLVSRAEMPIRARQGRGHRGPSGETELEDIIIAPVRDQLDLIAKTGLSTIITGPEGSGRHCAVHWLHSRRFPTGSLHCVHATSGNLPALIETLRQSMSQKGSRKQTLVVEAIESLPDGVQSDLTELLRSGPARLSDVQILGMSGLSVPKLKRENRLRPALLHALTVIPVNMPPLSARTEDLGLVADACLSKLIQEHSATERHFTTEARAFVKAQAWHGNLPELESTILRAVLDAPGARSVSLDDLSRAIHARHGSAASEQYADGTCAEREEMQDAWRALSLLLDSGLPMDRVVAFMETRAIEEADGNISAAAKRLGLTRAQLDYRRKARRQREY